jgi:hypothetical protein
MIRPEVLRAVSQCFSSSVADASIVQELVGLVALGQHVLLPAAADDEQQREGSEEAAAATGHQAM